MARYIEIGDKWIGGPNDDEDDPDNYEVIRVPAKNIVCPTCEGDGTHSNHLGAFTQSDREEMGEDFMDDYFAGHFDKVCEYCNGKGLQLVGDEDRMTDEEKALYQKYLADKDYEEELTYIERGPWDWHS